MTIGISIEAGTLLSISSSLLLLVKHTTLPKSQSLSSVTSLHIVDSIKQSPRHVHVLTFQGFQVGLGAIPWASLEFLIMDELAVFIIIIVARTLIWFSDTKPFPPGLSVADVQTTLKTIFPGGIPKKLPVVYLLLPAISVAKDFPKGLRKTISSHQNDGISFGNNFGNEVPKLQGSGLKVVPINNAKLHEFRVDASGGGTNRILLDLKNNKLFFTSDPFRGRMSPEEFTAWKTDVTYSEISESYMHYWENRAKPLDAASFAKRVEELRLPKETQ
ncbi:hypothetical protein BKA69DRAFT_1121061 [Paraphysoderma sedebokerense]|nr:hypothetical protein BKA69DRAFT_1121061 [Paraphysoderma sedebokerense]